MLSAYWKYSMLMQGLFYAGNLTGQRNVLTLSFLEGFLSSDVTSVLINTSLTTYKEDS
jgi:hypothetical protein